MEIKPVEATFHEPALVNIGNGSSDNVELPDPERRTGRDARPTKD
jgi:hypothetical protein